MKKTVTWIIVIILFLSAASGIYAQNRPVWTSCYKPGDISLSLSPELSFGAPLAISLIPGLEVFIFKPDFGGISPLDIGAALRVRSGMAVDAEAYMTAGAGLFASLHFNIKNFERLDIFADIGIKYDFFISGIPDGLNGFGFAMTDGISFAVTDSFALTAAYTLWGSRSGISIGGKVKLGGNNKACPEIVTADPAGSVPEKPAIRKDLEYHIPYLQNFQTLFWYTFAAGGSMPDDSSYSAGDSTVWSITAVNDGAERKYTAEKALLKTSLDGSKLWRAAISVGNEKLVAEFLLDKENRMLEFKYNDGGETYIYIPEKGTGWHPGPVNTIKEKEYRDYITESGTISTEAGDFDTDHIEYRIGESEYRHDWWVSRDVPGLVVKFIWEDPENSMKTARLIEIKTGCVPEL